MQKCMLAIAAALFVFALAITPTSAAEWCEHDPLVILTTPQGRTIEVYVTTYAQGAQYAVNLDRASITYVATPKRVDGVRGTRFDLVVLVPEGPNDPHFKTKAVVSSGEYATGTIYDADEGRSDRPMRLTFEVAAP